AKVAESLGKQAKAEEPRPVPQSSDEEDPDVALRLAAVESLQRHKKYAGRDLVSGYKRFLDDLKSYRAEWEKQNPKAVFELDDPAQDDSRDKQEADIEPEDTLRAEFDLQADANVNQALQQVRQERALEKAELQAERVIPTIEQGVVQDVGGDTLDALKEKD